MDVGQRCMMVGIDALDIAILLLAKVDIEVLRADVEIILFTLREVETMSIDRLPVVLTTTDRRRFGCYRRCTTLRLLSRAEEVVRLGIDKDSWSPVAHLTIVTD